MTRPCLFDPTESGHCATCGHLYPVACPVSGGDPVHVDSTVAAGRRLHDAARAFGAAAAGALGFAVALKFLADVIEGTVDDDRA